MFCQPTYTEVRPGAWKQKLQCQEYNSPLQSPDIAKATALALVTRLNPEPLQNGTISGRNQSPPGAGQGFPRDSVMPNITDILDRVRQIDFQKLCDNPQEEKEKAACTLLRLKIMVCLVEWRPECEEVAETLDSHHVQVPGMNGDESPSDRIQLSSLDDVDLTRLLKEAAESTSVDLLDSSRISIPVACQSVCTQDVNTLSRAYLCLICTIVDSLFHEPSTNTTIPAILE